MQRREELRRYRSNFSRRALACAKYVGKNRGSEVAPLPLSDAFLFDAVDNGYAC